MKWLLQILDLIRVLLVYVLFFGISMVLPAFIAYYIRETVLTSFNPTMADITAIALWFVFVAFIGSLMKAVHKRLPERVASWFDM